MKKFSKKKKIISSVFLLIILFIIFSFDPIKNYELQNFQKVDLTFTDSLLFNFDALIPMFKGKNNFTSRRKFHQYQSVKNLDISEERSEKYREKFYSVLLKDTLELNLDFIKNQNYKLNFWLKKSQVGNLKVIVDNTEITLEAFYSIKFSSEFSLKLKENSKIYFIKNKNIANDIYIEKPQIYTTIKRKPRQVIWTVIDALRQDLFEDKYKEMLPTFHEFSRKEQWYKRAVSSSNWTRPSTVSFLTGKFVRNVSKAYTSYVIDSTQQEFYLDKVNLTAAILFNQLNFDVVSFKNNVFLHDSTLGYDIGFPMQIIYDSDADDEEVLVGEMLRYIEAHGNRDIFIFLNTNTCHARYRSDMFSYFKALFNLPPHMLSSKTKYFGSAVVADDMLAYIISSLKQLDIYHNVKMILNSDHGELLRGDRYFHKNNEKMIFKKHGTFLPPEVFNVPLIFKGFNFKENEKKVTSLVDVLPSLYHFYTGKNSTYFDGLSLNQLNSNRSYFLTGDSHFSYVKGDTLYEAYSDRLFVFTDKRHRMKQIKTHIFQYRDSIRNIYYKHYLPIKKLLFLNKYIDVKSTHNLKKVDEISFGKKEYNVFEVLTFPFGLKIKGNSLYFQKLGKKISSKDLEEVYVSFYQKNVQENYMQTNHDNDFFFKTYSTKGFRAVLKQLDSDLKNQLKQWGYIQ